MKLKQTTDAATSKMKLITNEIKNLTMQEGKINKDEVKALANLFSLGEAFRRLVIYFLFMAEQHKKENINFPDFTQKYFNISKSESYKHVRRTKVELLIFEDDMEKLGTITNNSVLDLYASFDQHFYGKDSKKLWQDAVEISGDPNLVTLPVLRGLIKDKYEKLFNHVTSSFIGDEEYQEKMEWKQFIGKGFNGFREHDEYSFDKPILGDFIERYEGQLRFDNDIIKEGISTFTTQRIKELKAELLSILSIIEEELTTKKPETDASK